MPSQAKKLLPLIPPDKKQCQAEVPNGNTFMSLGGVPGRVRCGNKPSWISTEAKPGPDGRCGSMSLCDNCKQVLMVRLGADFATFKHL